MITNKGKGESRLRVGYRPLMLIILSVVGLALALPSFAFAADEWTSIGPSNYHVQTLHTSPNYANDYTIFAGTASNGVFRSTDQGKNWTQVNTGLTNQNIRAVAVSPNYTADHTVFAATAGGVFESTNTGDSWSPVNNGITSTDVRAVAISSAYADDQTVFVGTSSGVFKSTNGGSSWSSANTNLTNTDVRTIALSPNFGSDQTIFVGTYGGGVFKSTSGGTSWATASTGLTNSLITDISLSLDFPTDHVIFIGTYGAGVFKSTDAGGFWTQVNSGIASTDLYVLSVAVSPGFTRSKDDTVFAGTTGGVYKTDCAGAAWVLINNGLMHKLIPDISPTPCYCLDKTVYAGSEGGGVYSCVFSPSVPGPTTGLSVSNPAYPDGESSWFKTAPTITLACSTPGITKYQWDSTSTAWTTYSGSFTAIEGQHTLYYYSEDTSGNVEAYKSQVFTVDATLPNDPTLTSASHTVGSTSLDNTINITISGASDAGSGVDGYSVVWSNSPTTLPDRTVDITGTTVSFTSSPLADGTWYVHVSTKDKAGNWTSTAHLGSFTIDAVAPTTSISTVPAYTGGWTNTQPSISLSRSEAGVTFYQWDTTSSAGWQTYSASFNTPIGQHTLYYYSTDTAGNIEPYKSQVFKVDKTAPSAFTLSLPTNGASADNISLPTFEWNSSVDTESGIAKYQLYIDGKLDKEVTASELSCSSSTILTAGAHTWFVRAIDAAGNTQDAPSFTLNVTDKIAPVTTISTSPSYSGNWTKTSPSVSFTRNETGTTYYQWESTTGAWAPYSSSITAAEGTHVLYYRSVDSSGNTETARSSTFKVDNTKPTTVVLSTPIDGTSTTNASYPTFSWNASIDAGSGVAKYQLYVDGALKAETQASQLSSTLTSALSAGSHTWFVKAVDNAGNIADPSSTFTLNVADVIPPTTSVSSNPSSPNGTNGWYKSIPTITLTSNEPYKTYYQWDSNNPGGFTLYAGSLTASEGTHTLYYYSEDSAHNNESYKSLTYKVDGASPAPFSMNEPVDGTSTSNASYPTFTWVATSDSLSGLAKYQLVIDGVVKKDNISPSATSYTLTTPLSAGTHTWYVQAVDMAGNTRIANGGISYTLIVADVVSPVTSLSTSPSYPNGTNGWYKTMPTVTLSMNEAGTTKYQIDTSGWQVYSSSFTISDGQHTLSYYSYDTSANTETTKSKTFNVDTVFPQGFDISMPADGSFTTNASYPTFSWSPSTDTGSGIAKYQLYIDGSLKRDNIAASATSYTLTAPLTAGIHTWYVYAVDAAGNATRSNSSFTLNVTDVVPPATTLSTSPSSSDGSNGWYKTVPSITLSSNESGNTYYQWDNTLPGGWLTYSGSITGLEGQHTLYYYSMDSTNNTETIKSKTYKVDTTYPTDFDLIGPSDGSGTNNASYPTFSWSASTDTYLAKYQLVIDGVVNRDNISPSATQYTITTPLTPGTHTWYINAVDSAGNVKRSTSVFSITVGDAVAPVTTLSSSPGAPDGNSGWYKTTPTVTLTRSEAGTTYYHWDSSADTTVSASTVSFQAPEGQHTLYYHSEDMVPNIETIKSKTYKVDTTYPTDFDLIGPSDGSGTNNASYPTFSWSASTDTNLAKYQLYVDGSLARDNISPSATQYTITTPLTPGTHTWYINAVDSAGNVKRSTSVFSINVADAVPPVTTLSTSPSSPDGTNSWWKTSPGISLTRNEPGSTNFQWDSSGWQTYSTGGIPVSQGTHTLYYQSWDNDNNTETVKSKVFKIDTSAPDPFDIIEPASGSTTNNQSYPTFKWLASNDTVSGLSKYQLVIDGVVAKDYISSSATQYTITAPLSTGEHTWYVNAVDAAGNVKRSTSVFSISVADSMPPVTSLSTNPISPTGNNSWFTNMPSITLTRNEPGTTFYSWDSSGSWISYDAATSGFKPLEGQHTLNFYSADSVGNTETVKTQVIKMDLTAPSLIVSTPTDGLHITAGSSYTISGTAADTGGSGVSKVEISVSNINNGAWQTASGTTSWSYNWSLPSDGSYTIKARVTDIAGLVSPEATLNVFVDKTAPSVTSRGPVPGATDVNVGTNITATFSEDIDPATVNTSTFQVIDGGSNVVAGSVQYNQASKTATFYPNSLNYSASYTVTLTTGIKDLSGTSLSSTSWTFSTKTSTSIPVTSLTIVPANPDGSSGWYKTQPTIWLSSDLGGTTYYQWDEGALEVYPGSPIPDVPQGSHTLSYFSVFGGVTETAVSRSLSMDWTKPSAPTNTVATAMSSNCIKVTWDAASDNVGVTGYKLYYKSQGGSTQTITGISAGSYSYTLNNLTGDTTYTCTVAAYDAAGNVSDQSASANARTLPSTPTSDSGTKVTVGNIDLEFTQITKPGTTTISIDEKPSMGSPEGFKLRGYVFDINTTANFAGDVTVTVHYDPAVVPGEERNLKLMHWNGQHWEDITVNLDTANRTIVGVTKSFSEIAMFTPFETNVSGVSYGMNTDLLLAFSLTLMITGAWLMLRRRSAA